MLKKYRVGLLLAACGSVAVMAGVIMLKPSGSSHEALIRTERNMTSAEQRELLQMFFPSELPVGLLDIRVESFLPAMGDGEVHASFRVTPLEAKKIISTLHLTADSGAYTSQSFQGATGSIRVDDVSGLVSIDWSEH